MSIAKWDLMAPSPRICSIDRPLPTTNFANSYNLGIAYVGGVKSVLRRPLFAFDLYAPPVVGSPLVGGELISDAYIEAYCLGTIGSVSQPAWVSRVTRYDWIKTEATWNIYRTANNWTQVGGDVDIVTPTRSNWTTPAGIGAFTIPGLLGFATDAITNRGAIVNLLMQLVDQTDDGVQRWHSAGTNPTDPIGERLLFCIDYQGGDGPVPRQGPTTGRLARMPQYDHILGQRREGATIRQLKGARRGFEEGTRARELVLA